MCLTLFLSSSWFVCRCTRSVSVCPPAYCKPPGHLCIAVLAAFLLVCLTKKGCVADAHLAAARGRCLLDRLDTTEGTTTTEAKDRLHVSHLRQAAYIVSLG